VADYSSKANDRERQSADWAITSKCQRSRPVNPMPCASQPSACSEPPCSTNHTHSELQWRNPCYADGEVSTLAREPRVLLIWLQALEAWPSWPFHLQLTAEFGFTVGPLPRPRYTSRFHPGVLLGRFSSSSSTIVHTLVTLCTRPSPASTYTTATTQQTPSIRCPRHR